MQLSFRDPDGFVFRLDGRILRCVYPQAAGSLRRFLSSAAALEWMSRGTMRRTTILAGGPPAAVPAELRERIPEDSLLLEHEPVAFASYPYEWPPEMLLAAGRLTLQLARDSIAEGWRLKDATPYNIMFDGPKPVFLDVLSFAPADPLNALWRPYAQFVRTFAYPLLANRHFGLRLDEMLLAHRDGLEPEMVARLCSPWRLLLPPFLGSVAIPLLMSRRQNGAGDRSYRQRQAKDPEEAKYLLESVLARAGRLLDNVSIPAGEGEVARYAESGHRYAPPEMAAKIRVVAEALEACRARDVLDLGCNTGQFSAIAARLGARVVAIDRDPEATGAVWTMAASGGMDILPLVVDLAWPPGARGWANGEYPSFLDRARGRFDCVLMLALIHHLLVGERVPLDRILDLASELTRRDVIIEFVDPADEQFQRIARGRDALHRDLDSRAFEAAARRHFAIAGSWQVTATRRIYLLRKGRA